MHEQVHQDVLSWAAGQEELEQLQDISAMARKNVIVIEL